jgi:serine phosphatase RsbU (regulator of sigma subunit)
MTVPLLELSIEKLRDEEVFGIARIQEICEAELYIASAQLLGQIFVALENYTRGRKQHDDMTAAVFQYEGGESLSGFPPSN